EQTMNQGVWSAWVRIQKAASRATSGSEPIGWLLQSHWPEISFASQQQADAPAEATLLRLDSSRARQNLGWTPVWGLEDTVQKTVQWYKSYYHQGLVLSGRQLQEYMQQAQSLNISWAKN
ncbi:MAG: hypothetical protein R6U22_10335, partial [Desulfohalobiaceae bacterium]